ARLSTLEASGGMGGRAGRESALTPAGTPLELHWFTS
ncbi:hypothetical protein RRG08_034032, partial [Elysia crispata]